MLERWAPSRPRRDRRNSNLFSGRSNIPVRPLRSPLDREDESATIATTVDDAHISLTRTEHVAVPAELLDVEVLEVAALELLQDLAYPTTLTVAQLPAIFRRSSVAKSSP